MKKKIVFSLILILTLFISCHNQKIGRNLIENPGFEKTGSATIESWREDTYIRNNPGVLFLREEGAAYKGNAYASITARSHDDSKLVQTVKVKPEKKYRLSGYIRAENIPTTHAGANLSILGAFAATPSLYDTDGNWEYVEFYGETGKDQYSVDIALRLGGYSSDNTGHAEFDQIELVEVKKVPSEALLLKMYIPPPVKMKSIKEKKAEIKKDTTVISMETIILFAGLYIALFLFVYFFFLRSQVLASISKVQFMLTLFGLLGIALLSRLIVAPLLGYENDIGCFRAWSAHAARTPFSRFYTTISFFDYPPVAVYLFALIGHIRNFFSVTAQSGVDMLIMKLPSILADVITAYLIYHIAAKHLKRPPALGLSILYMFNPTVFINSAVWGQMDSIAALLVLLVLYLMLSDRIVHACLVFTIGVFLKWQSGFLALCLIVAIMEKIITGIQKKHKEGNSDQLNQGLKELGFSILGVLILLYAIILPFNSVHRVIIAGLWILFALFLLAIRRDPLDWLRKINFPGTGLPQEKIKKIFGLSGLTLFVVLLGGIIATGSSLTVLGTSVGWLIGRFSGAMGNYPYATINMFNFYALINGNWAALNTHFWGLSYRSWGLFFASLTLVTTLLFCVLARGQKKYPVVSLYFITMVVMFYVVMHERYHYPALMLSLLCFCYTKDRRYLWIFLGFSITNFLNVAYVLDILIKGIFINNKDKVMLVGAAANIAMTLFLVYTTARVCFPGNTKNPSPASRKGKIG